MRLAEKLLYDIVRSYLESGQGEIDACDEYAEPGYSTDTPDAPILFADWNESHATPASDPLRGWSLNSIRTLEDAGRIYIKRITERDARNRIARIGALAERLGWGVEWSDEWTICYAGGSCNKAVRTRGDSYSWTPSFVMFDGEIQCKECALEDADALEEYLTDNADAADTFGVDWNSRGWRLTRPGYESGWHAGQDANPHDILKSLNSHNVEALFSIDGTGQFDIRFSLWVRPLNSRHGSGVWYDPAGE